jgi:hypothetical protein
MQNRGEFLALLCVEDATPVEVPHAPRHVRG